MITLVSTNLALALISAAPEPAPNAASRTALVLHDPGGARADTYLRFVLHSKKAGFINSQVEGYVHDFDVSYDWTGTAATRGDVGFAVRAMRTDNGGRDDKMWSFCLDAEHHPRVQLTLDGDIPLGRRVEVPARIYIRGAWHPLRVTAELQRAEDKLIVAGAATVKLSELNIPDPSIWIAKVDNTIELTFHVVTPPPNLAQTH
jgi:polyisoprenoid-binding protein YceI